MWSDDPKSQRKIQYLLRYYEIHVFVNTPDGCISLYEAKLAGYSDAIKKAETTKLDISGL